VIAIVCQHENRKKFGKTPTGTPRFRCKDCGKTFTQSTDLFDGMRIGLDRAAKIVELLCEGMSVSAAARVTDTDPHTIIDLLNLIGERCERYMAEVIRDVPVDEVQCDEIWQFVFCKNATAQQKKYVGGAGDSWCWTAIERHTKLLVTWHHGRRTLEDSHAFMRKLAVATVGRFHLSTDGYGTYEQSVRWNLGQRVDYGQVSKIFGKTSKEDQRRYSPAKIIGCDRRVVSGKPELRKTSTSHCERLNGSIRNFTKRMGRLTYCFSKRWDNHRAALALYFCHYNFCRKHRTLKGQTPAMAHGLAAEVWTVRDMLQKISVS
jgi:IS1 family transposase/transposase-like protein